MKKRRLVRHPILLAAVALVALMIAAVAWFGFIAPADETAVNGEIVAVETGDGGHYEFHVEIAATPEQQSRGLMHRRELAPDAGMLFDFGRERDIFMWMKNTLIPLDMMFIDGEGRIVKIHERAVPLSKAPIAATQPVRAVLEVPGGTSDRLGIEAGDTVVHAIFER